MSVGSSQSINRDPRLVTAGGADRRRNRWLLSLSTLKAFALGLAVISALSLAVVIHTERETTPDASTSGLIAPTDAEIAAVLAVQSTAIVHRDSDAFARTLDPGSAASKYRAQELAAYQNLAGVPLASWAITIDAAVTATDEVAAASTRLGASARIVKVRLAYALQGVDAAPTTHPLWLTFVHRAGRTVIASDTDLADAAGVSWRGLWDFGQVVAYRGVSSLILSHPSHASQLAGYAAVVDSAVTAVSGVWGSDWSRHVAVLIPDSQNELSAVIGNNFVFDQIDAVSVADEDPTAGSAALGQRVILNPANLNKLSDIGTQIVIRHEVTLIAVRPTSGSAMPTWLIEGLAEYVANLDTGQTVPFAAAELSRDVKAGALPSALPTTADFNGENTALAQTYEQSWLACKFIADRHSPATLLAFYRAVAAATQAVPAQTSDDAVTSALRSVLGDSPADFVAGWVAYLRSELG